MAISEKDLSNQRKSALTAGISLIIMTLASFFRMALSMRILLFRAMPASHSITLCHRLTFSKVKFWVGSSL